MFDLWTSFTAACNFLGLHLFFLVGRIIVELELCRRHDDILAILEFHTVLIGFLVAVFIGTSLLSVACINLSLNRDHNFVDSTPLVLILGESPDHVEALQDVDDVIDASSLDSKLFGTLVEEEEAPGWSSIQE